MLSRKIRDQWLYSLASETLEELVKTQTAEAAPPAPSF